MSRLALVLLMLLAATSATSARDLTAFLSAQALYLRGVEGDSTANEQAQALLQALTQVEPADPLLQVYLGATYTLQGRDAWLPWSKVHLTEEGLDRMAKSLKLLPKEPEQLANGAYLDLEVKVLCAITFTQVPQLFGRFEQGEQLFAEVFGDARFAQVPASRQAEVYYYAALAKAEVAKGSEALTLAKQALALAPSGPVAAKSQALITEVQ